MNFRDYKWFNNPRGLRNNGPYTALDPERYTNPRMGWAKLVVGGTEHVDEVGRLLGHGCMPIIQVYREQMGAALADEAWFDVYAQYVKAGALWFELYDEPNAPAFWPKLSPDWIDQDRCIGPVMDGWLDWAERIVGLGAYPGFPAMAETTVPEQSTVAWYEACLGYLSQRRADRFGRLMASGLWCATHPVLLNHFYQEPPGGPPSAARPYYQQSHKEGGWHFEYPYDPLQQHDDPGRTPFGGTAKSPFGDPNGLVCSGEIFTELLMKMFGAGPVPVVGTAGGITPIPEATAEPIQTDTRYQGYSRDSHGEATAAMFRWIAESGPPWLIGLALSSEAGYYPGGVAIPAIGLLAADPPATKEGPDLEIRPGKVAQALINAAMESSPLDPFAPEEGAAPAQEPGAAEAPAREPAKSEAELGDLVNLNLMMPQPIISTLTESAPVDTTLKEVEPPVTTLAESGPYGDPYAALGKTGAEIPMPDFEDIAPIDPEQLGDPYSALEKPGPVTPEPESEPAARVEAAPEEDAAPVSTLWPAPDAQEEALPDVIAMPASFDEPEEQMTSATVLWPAPDVKEEAPEPSPLVEPAEPEEQITSATILWPAPEAREEAPEPSPLVEPAEAERSEPGAAGLFTGMASSRPAEKLGPGPGPLGETASDHWLMLAPDLPASWLIGAARRYWDAFRTPIVSDPGLIGALPPERSLAVTLLASRAGATTAGQALAAEWPNVQVDVVAGDTLAELQAELDRRARERKEFG